MQTSRRGFLQTIDKKIVPPVYELLLVESDNLLYSDVTLLLPKLPAALRSSRRCVTVLT